MSRTQDKPESGMPNRPEPKTARWKLQKLPEMDGFGALSQIFMSDLLFTNSQENHGHCKPKGLSLDQG